MSLLFTFYVKITCLFSGRGGGFSDSSVCFLYLVGGEEKHFQLQSQQIVTLLHRQLQSISEI